jgi:phosphoglycolate phosphatase-like HAD superfamily hydrolase
MILTSTRAALAVATLGLVVGGTGVAVASGQGSGQGHGGYDHGGAPNDIPNLGLVKTDIKAYYGDTGTAQPAPDSRYADDVAKVERRASNRLPQLLKHADAKPAIVVDVDDTSLSTYNYEALNDFGYNPAVNAKYIHETGMKAVFGMPQLLTAAAKRGVEVFYVTGRPTTDAFGSTQRADTLRDLSAAGYPDVRPAHLFTRDKPNPPAYLQSCDKPNASPATFCTTVQYKSLTRQHIEHLGGGQDVVQNFGDQFSDLQGGYSDATYKLPNPMYFLP